MVTSVIKANSVIVAYETLTNEGRLQNKRQVFNLVAYDATDEDFYQIGSAIGNMLVSNPKEILKTTTALLVEA